REARLSEARYHRLLSQGLQVAPQTADTAFALAAGPREANQQAADAATSQSSAVLEQWLSSLPLSPLTPRERQAHRPTAQATGVRTSTTASAGRERNLLLASLPDVDYARLLRDLRDVWLDAKRV